jgi:hypothetical protein
MTRILFRIRFSSQSGLGLALGMVLGWSLASPCAAAGLSTFLTARDRSRPVLLSETGQPIQLRSLIHPDPVPPQGTVPAYLAFPLYGGERLPSDTPTLATGPPAGQTTVGPLNLDPLVQAKLNAALDASGMAVVETPNRNYAVEFVPRYARSHAQAGTTSGTASSSGSGAGSSGGLATAPASPSSASKSQPVQTINGIPTNELSHWVDLGTNQLIHWSSISVANLEKTLSIGSSNTSDKKPGSSPAAEELQPPLAAPIPEPSSWLVFGLIVGAAGLRQWIGKTA